MKLNDQDRSALVKILHNVATASYDALSGEWDKSDAGFEAMQASAEKGLLILNANLPDYEPEEDEPEHANWIATWDGSVYRVGENREYWSDDGDEWRTGDGKLATDAHFELATIHLVGGPRDGTVVR